MISQKRRFAMLLALVVSSFFMSACNTIRGAGQDIENAGDAIEDAAD
jgi:predicted small secreted protein